MNPIFGITWIFFILLAGILEWCYWCVIQFVGTGNVWYFVIAQVGAVVWLIFCFHIIPSDAAWVIFEPKNNFERSIMNWWIR